LEAGSTASSFEFRHYQQELALCQRYFAIGLPGNSDFNWPVVRDVTTGFSFVVTLPVPMRATPILGIPSGYGRIVAYDTSFGLSTRSVTAMVLLFFFSGTQANIFCNTSALSGAAGVFCAYDTIGATTDLTLSAEL
jgi:hypothetical protein